ncbi:MAG: PAS domain S-box protein, partial [Calditrichaceae bacterium]
MQFGIDKSQIGIFQIDEKAKIRYVNDYACEKLGYTRKELLKLSVMDIDANFDYKSWKENRDKIKEGYTNTFETIHIRKDGTRYPAEITVNYLSFEDKPISFTFVKDVTEQKRIQTALNESEKRYRTLIERSTDAMFLINKSENIVEVNKQACRLLGYSKNELLSMKLKDMDVDITRDDEYRELWNTLKPGKPFIFESRLLKKAGGVIPVEISIGLVELQDEEFILGFVRDISDRKESERKIRDNEENLRITLNSIGDGVIATDARGKITRMNPMAEQLTGWSQEESRGLILSKVFNIVNSKTGKKTRNPVQKILKNGETIGLANDTALISKDGQKYQIADSGAPILDKDGNITGVVLVFRDVTKEYEIYSQLRESRRNLEDAQARAHLGSWDLNISTGYGYWSREMYKLYRRDPKLGEPSFDEFIEYIHPEDRKTLLNAHKGVIKDKKTRVIEYRTNPPNGTVRIISGQIAYEKGTGARDNILLGTCLDITERKQAEQALSESEARFRGLIEASPDAIFITDYSSRMLYTNSTLEKQTGYTAADFQMTQEENTFIHPKDAPKVAEFIKDFIKSDHQFSGIIENRFIDKKGNLHWYSSRIAKIEFEGQTALQFIARDITEEQKIREALSNSEKQYRALFETMAQGVVYQDSKGRLTSGNPAALKILGLTHDQLTGRTSVDPRWRAVREDGTEFPGLEHPGMQALKTGKRVDDVMMGVFNPIEDQYRWLLVSAIPEFRNSEKNPYQVFSTFTDITEIKQTEDALKYNTSVLEESQKVARLGHYYLEINEGSWHSSIMLDSIFGIKPGIKKDFAIWVNLLHPDFKQEMVAYFQNYVLGQKHNFDKEYKIIRLNDKKERWVHGLGRLEYNSEGQPVRMIGTIQDITERKLLEEQLMHSQKMEAVGQLAGGVAHDFNNMLTVINGYSELLLNKGISKDLRNSIQEIQNASIRATRLTSQLLAFSRKQIIQPKIVSINKLITEQINMLRRLLGEDVEISTLFDARLRPVKVDISQMEQVIMNISINARDAMPLGGKLIIETKNVEFGDKDREKHPEIKKGRYSLLSFSDTGIGMDKLTKSRIFEPFYTT